MRDSYTPTSGDARYRVERYELDLTYTPRTNRLLGRAVLHVLVEETTDALRVDLLGLRVKRVRVDGAPHREVKQGSRSVLVRLGEALPAGSRLAVAIEYAGSPAPRRSPWGRIGWEELTEGALVAAQPNGAPTWFPCNDRIDDRAQYELRFTTDAEFFVAASGVPGSVTRRGGVRTWTFTSGAPTATYLMTVHVGPYRERPLPVVAGRAAARLVAPGAVLPAAEVAFAPLTSMLEVFERWFGPYPQAHLAVVVVGEELEIPLESQGLVTFGLNHLVPAERRLIAHELAHQWFGNSVAIGRWGDIWLNEGFSCFAEWVWSEESGGPSIADMAETWHARLTRMSQDLVLGDPGPELMFDDRVYKRGALTLEALRRTIGDAPFRVLLRNWAEAHRHRLVSTADFRAYAQAHTETSLEPLWDQWLTRGQLPNLPPRPR